MTATKQQTLARFEQHRISAIIRTADQDLARDAMAAAVAGGLRLVEFTLTTPGALELIAEFASNDELTVGAGTVMSADQVRDAGAAGAAFLVSPVVDPTVIEAINALGAVSIPGAYTPTEMETAHRCGADFIKVFPAPAGGVGFIRALRGPLPHLRLFPTAGPTPDNFVEYLDAGCAGVGLVRSLFTPEDMAASRMDAIRDRAAAVVDRLRTWQSG